MSTDGLKQRKEHAMSDRKSLLKPKPLVECFEGLPGPRMSGDN